MNETERNVVVGVDGTDSSAALLRWAREFALQVDARLRIVLAWQPPDLASLVPFRVEMSLVQVAEDRLAELVHHNVQGVEADSVVAEGSPSRVLLEAAKNADYLLIGRPDGVDPRRSGSIAAYCANHATCPVIVVPVRKAAS